jgi:hypothetical protein
MQSRDLSGFSLRSTGQHSRLLSEDSFLPSEQDDLSLSELSLADQAYNPKPFSLLAQPAASSSNTDRPVTPENTHPPEDDDEGTPRDHDRDNDGNNDGDDDLDTLEGQERRAQKAAKAREEKLQNDLFILRKMNASFAVLNDALRETQSGAQVGNYSLYQATFIFVISFSSWSHLSLYILIQRVEEQLAQTETLLNKYANLLAKSEKVSRLLLDERWQGGVAVSFDPPTFNLLPVLILIFPRTKRSYFKNNARPKKLDAASKKSVLERPNARKNFVNKKNESVRKEKKRNGARKSVKNAGQHMLLGVCVERARPCAALQLPERRWWGVEVYFLCHHIPVLSNRELLS